MARDVSTASITNPTTGGHPPFVRSEQSKAINQLKDNDWESIASGANQDEKIKRWIAEQMQGRTCTIVLVGASTAKRKWINHEIIKSWTDGLGVVGIRIHGLKNRLR